VERLEAVTRRLILMRHGQAHPEQPRHQDFARKLTERGRRDAAAMGGLLVRHGWIPDAIVASPAERTAATTRIVAQACGFDLPRIVWAPELYLADAERFWGAVEAQDAASRCVLICGHNPGLSRLASLLGEPATRRELPTAGLITGTWRAGDWRSIEPGTAVHCEALAPHGGGD
jgi:phosphohistidine phosphatase